MQSPSWKSIVLLALLLAVVGGAALAQAQAAPYRPAAAAFATRPPKPPSGSSSAGPSADHKWEFEFHGGVVLSSSPDGGSAALPAPGAAFTLVNGTTSRAISSYYFGDGTLLYNQAVDAAAFPGINAHITPLDPILTRQTATRAHGAGFGARISRDLTPRWTIEANVDFNLGQMELSSAAITGIEVTRASWQTAWTQNFTGLSPVLKSTATVHSSEGYQVFGTAGVNFNLMKEGRVIPYLSVGGGALANTGEAPTAALLGNFTVNIFGIPHNNTDSVLVAWGLPDVQGVGYVGGGVKFYVTPRWGVRMDVRDYISGNGLKQSISASPAVLTQAPAGAQDFSGVSPNLQLSNNPASGADTLSGPALTRFPTFSGDGMRHQVVMSGGIFYRF